MTDHSIFETHGLFKGRCFGSKSAYRQRYQHRIIVFNANICTKEQGKIWHGDIDMTKDAKALQRIANSLGQTLYVLSEMDARFDNEIDPKFENAIEIIEPDDPAFTG